MANKDFIYFLPQSMSALNKWAIENALHDIVQCGNYGTDEGRYYILTNNELEWRSKMGRLKRLYEFYLDNKVNITFTSDDKLEKAKKYLEANLVPYNERLDSPNQLIVHCVVYKQKALIEELKKYVRKHQPTNVTI